MLMVLWIDFRLQKPTLLPIVKDLNNKAFGRLLGLLIGLAALLFIPAWTLDYWQAWVFLAVFSLSMLGLTVYLIKSNPALLERRLNSRPSSEKRRKQKIVASLVSSSLIVAALLPAIDHRCAWSRVPACVVGAGDVLVALGVLTIGRSSRRTPSLRPLSRSVLGRRSYPPALTLSCDIPCILVGWSLFRASRSRWAHGGHCFLIIPVSLLIAWRLLDEEMFLAKNMPDYVAYRKKVRYRLVPFVW